MSRNKTGALNPRAAEWGSKARKEEDRLRNTNARASRENIVEQLAEITEWDFIAAEERIKAWRDAEMLNEALDATLPDAITFNGQPVRGLDDELGPFEWYEEDE